MSQAQCKPGNARVLPDGHGFSRPSWRAVIVSWRDDCCDGVQRLSGAGHFLVELIIKREVNEKVQVDLLKSLYLIK